MTPLNYNHLFYFYRVATDGGITRASEQLHLTPQTISGQITKLEESIGIALFERRGKKLHLTPMGKIIYEYAEEIFHLGDELSNMLKNKEIPHGFTFTVGITDAIPKVLAFSLIKPVFELAGQTRLLCKEGNLDQLLADLAVNRIDMILTDRPLQPDSRVKAYNHQVAESGVTFFAHPALATNLSPDFPHSLSGQPFIMQGKHSNIHQRLIAWFESNKIVPNVVAEFDDSALMKAFGQEGIGIFTAPTMLEQHISSQYGVLPIGRTEVVKERYYAISPERKVKHPSVLTILDSVVTADA